MNVETCVVGPIQTNCYIVEDSGETIVIDPGDNCARIVGKLAGRTVKEIVLTHYHWDHVSALSELEEALGAPAAMSALDAEKVDGCSRVSGHDIDRGHGAPHIDRLLREGDEVVVGSCVFEVIETPGHTPGSICLYCAGEKALFAGDTLFSGGRFGRTDFVDGSMEAMVTTLGSKFKDVSGDTVVYSGHERSSTMELERTLNPHLQ